MIRTSVRSSDGLRLVRKTAICGGAKDQSEDGGSNKAAESINIILLFIVCRMKVTVKDSSETGCVNCVVIRKRERERQTRWGGNLRWPSSTPSWKTLALWDVWNKKKTPSWGFSLNFQPFFDPTVAEVVSAPYSKIITFLLNVTVSGGYGRVNYQDFTPVLSRRVKYVK